MIQHWKESIKNTCNKTRKINLLEVEKVILRNLEKSFEVRQLNNENTGEIEFTFTIENIEFRIGKSVIRNQTCLCLFYIYFDVYNHISKLKSKDNITMFDIKNFNTNIIKNFYFYNFSYKDPLIKIFQ